MFASIERFSVAQIFISYTRQDIAAARQVRNALRGERMNVWWDEDLQGGQRWSVAIDEALLAADIIVVLWSNRSVESDWVRHEAAIGKVRNVLMPVKIEECDLPAMFSEIQTVDLVGWQGNERDGRFRELMVGFAGVLRRRRRSNLIRNVRIGVALIVVGLLGAGVGIYYHKTEVPTCFPAECARLDRLEPPAMWEMTWKRFSGSMKESEEGRILHDAGAKTELKAPLRGREMACRFLAEFVEGAADTSVGMEVWDPDEYSLTFRGGRLKLVRDGMVVKEMRVPDFAGRKIEVFLIVKSDRVFAKIGEHVFFNEKNPGIDAMLQPRVNADVGDTIILHESCCGIW